jgi:hypothetical protein
LGRTNAGVANALCRRIVYFALCVRVFTLAVRQVVEIGDPFRASATAGRAFVSGAFFIAFQHAIDKFHNRNRDAPAEQLLHALAIPHHFIVPLGVTEFVAE